MRELEKKLEDANRQFVQNQGLRKTSSLEKQNSQIPHAAISQQALLSDSKSGSNSIAGETGPNNLPKFLLEENSEIKFIKEQHRKELSHFKNLMTDLKATYDAREKAYQRKLFKCKSECEIKVQELEAELESLNRQVKILKSIQLK